MLESDWPKLIFVQLVTNLSIRSATHVYWREFWVSVKTSTRAVEQSSNKCLFVSVLLQWYVSQLLRRLWECGRTLWSPVITSLGVRKNSSANPYVCVNTGPTSVHLHGLSMVPRTCQRLEGCLNESFVVPRLMGVQKLGWNPAPSRT